MIIRGDALHKTDVEFQWISNNPPLNYRVKKFSLYLLGNKDISRNGI